jgi:hypothetical protein
VANPSIHIEDVPEGFNGATGPVRAMLSGGKYQSAVALVDGEPDPIEAPIFRYIRCLDLIHWYRPDRGSVLYLGLGAGIAPSRAATFAPMAKVQAVEINPEVIDAARGSFGLSPLVDVHIGDAIEWILSTSEKFDVVVVDVCDFGRVPTAFCTQNFLRSVSNTLNPDGLVAMNLIGAVSGQKNDLMQSIIGNFTEVFENVHLYPINNYDDDIDLTAPFLNVEIFTSNGSLTSDFSSVTELGGMKSDDVLRRIIGDKITPTFP